MRPPAKFSSSMFAISEVFAEPPMPAMLPVTLRHVEADLKVNGLNAGSSSVTKLRVDADTEIRRWMKTVERFAGFSLSVSQIKEDMPQGPSNRVKPAYAQGSTTKDRKTNIRRLSTPA